MSDTETTNRAAMNWDRKRAGWYEAKAEDGSNWRIVQVTSRRWEVYRDGAPVADWPITLTDAKWIAEREQQPATERPAEDFRIAYARRILAETETRPDDYGAAYGQRTNLRLVLTDLLAYVAEIKAERGES